MNKKDFLIRFVFICTCLLAVSCSKGGADDPNIPAPPVVGPDTPDTPDTPDKPVYPTFDAPKWNVEDIASFEHTMTVSVVLHDSIGNNEYVTDEMSVFVGDECRGCAERLEVSSGKNVWISLVYGNDESEKMIFRYYSSKTKHMYQSDVPKNFIIDGHIGTIDIPETIGMKIVTK